MSHHYSALTDFSLKLLYIHVKMHFEEFFFFNLLTYIYSHLLANLFLSI